MAIFQFIEGWYNPGRRHSAPDYQSPIIDRKRACDGVRIPKSKPVRPGKGFVVPRSAIFGYHSGQFEGHLGNVESSSEN